MVNTTYFFLQSVRLADSLCLFPLWTKVSVMYVNTFQSWLGTVRTYKQIPARSQFKPIKRDQHDCTVVAHCNLFQSSLVSGFLGLVLVSGKAAVWLCVADPSGCGLGCCSLGTAGPGVPNAFSANHTPLLIKRASHWGTLLQTLANPSSCFVLFLPHTVLHLCINTSLLTD